VMPNAPSRVSVKGDDMWRSPKVDDIAKLVHALEKHPFGSLVLVLLILSIACVVAAASH
jgi:hypothetical protein